MDSAGAKWTYIGKLNEGKLFFFKNFATSEIGFVDCEDHVDAFINSKEARKWVIDPAKLITIRIAKYDIEAVVPINGGDATVNMVIEDLIWLLNEDYMSSKQVVLRPPLNKLIPIFKHRIFEAAKDL